MNPAAGPVHRHTGVPDQLALHYSVDDAVF
jgi:hypothetical protein